MTYLPPSRPGTSAIRIGDAERDAAISVLADHFAAGRLTKDEYDERADRVNTARFDADLAPLFADLPSTPARDTTKRTASRSGRRHPAFAAGPLLWFAPLLAIGAVALVVTALVLISPWLLLWPLMAAFWFGRAGHGCGNRNRHYHRGAWARTRQPWQRA